MLKPSPGIAESEPMKILSYLCDQNRISTPHRRGKAWIVFDLSPVLLRIFLPRVHKAHKYSLGRQLGFHQIAERSAVCAGPSQFAFVAGHPFDIVFYRSGRTDYALSALSVRCIADSHHIAFFRFFHAGLRLGVCVVRNHTLAQPIGQLLCLIHRFSCRLFLGLALGIVGNTSSQQFPRSLPCSR